MFLMPGMNGGARRAGAYTIAAGTGLSYYWLRQQTDKPQFVRIVHAACIILNRKIAVLLSNDEYDIIKKIISNSVNFAEPVLYIYKAFNF
jgi:hypothetical protein